MCDYYIVLPYGNIYDILFDIITRDIVVVACFVKCIFAPESDIASMLLLGDLGGVLIKFIKIILGLLISILLIITPNRHSHPFSFLLSIFL